MRTMRSEFLGLGDCSGCGVRAGIGENLRVEKARSWEWWEVRVWLGWGKERVTDTLAHTNALLEPPP